MTRPWSSPDRDAGDADAPTGPDDHVIDIEVEGEAARRLVDPTDDHADTVERPRRRSADWRRVAGIVIAIAFAVGVTAVVMILASDDVEAPTEPTPAPDDTVTATLPPATMPPVEDGDGQDDDATPTTIVSLLDGDPDTQLRAALDAFGSLDRAGRTTIEFGGADGQRIVQIVEYDRHARRYRIGEVPGLSADDPLRSVRWITVVDADAGTFTREEHQTDGSWERTETLDAFDDGARAALFGPLGSSPLDGAFMIQDRRLAVIDGELIALYVLRADNTGGDDGNIAHRYYVDPGDGLVRAQVDDLGRSSIILDFEVLDELDIPLPDVDHG